MKEKYSILIVDDEIQGLEILERLLVHDYRILKAENGEEALRILRQEEVDMILADQRMPTMTGVELFERTIQLCSDTVRIIITGYMDVEASIQAINRGQVYRYITKPWEPEEVKIIVKQGLEWRNLTQRNKKLVEDLSLKNRALELVNEKLKRTQQELVEGERLRIVGKMANMIIHDFNSPLSVIKAYADLLMRTQSDPTEIEEYCKNILKGVSQMTEMAKELLEFSKGNNELSFNRYLVNDFIEEIISSLKLTFQQQKVNLEKKLDYTGEIFFDGEKIRRLFFNLATNALEAMPEGGIFYISNRLEEDGVEFLLSDTGKGIPPDRISNIFEPFVSYGKKKGTGLGLAIVKNIIDHHQGRIWVESERDRGTTFHFTLPYNLCLNEREGICHEVTIS